MIISAFKNLMIDKLQVVQMCPSKIAVFWVAATVVLIKLNK